MNVGGCLLLITIVAWSSVLVTSENSPIKARSERHILPLLGFLQGYKIGQNFALQLPPFVVSPIVVLPSVNQQQSINIHGSTEDNLDESGGTLQIIAPAKLVQQSNETDNHEIDTDVEHFVTTEAELELDENISEDDTFRQNVIGINNSTTSTQEPERNNSITTTTETTDISTTEDDINITTKAHGPYPTAVYDNELVNSITLTEAPIETMFVLPSMENKWQNFSSNKNEKGNADNEDLEARSDDAWGNIFTYPTRPSYSHKIYPYPPSYNNIDSSYISNSYGPDYSNHNRWQTYSSPEKYGLTSQFRPLAGLYYDGFLHRSPVKKTGFVPYNNNYYY